MVTNPVRPVSFFRGLMSFLLLVLIGGCVVILPKKGGNPSIQFWWQDYTEENTEGGFLPPTDHLTSIEEELLCPATYSDAIKVFEKRKEETKNKSLDEKIKRLIDEEIGLDEFIKGLPGNFALTKRQIEAIVMGRSLPDKCRSTTIKQGLLSDSLVESLELGMLYNIQAVEHSLTRNKKTSCYEGLERNIELYSRSNAYLTEAKDLIECRYARRLSKEALRWLFNHTALDYEGEIYEKNMLYIIMALNFAYQGKRDNALIEFRQLLDKYNEYEQTGEDGFLKDFYWNPAKLNSLLSGEYHELVSYKQASEIYQKLRALGNRRFEEKAQARAFLENQLSNVNPALIDTLLLLGRNEIYREDAFGHYLNGIMLEWDGQWENALVSYSNAHEFYLKYSFHYKTPVPFQLILDQARVARTVGLDAYEKVHQQFNLKTSSVPEYDRKKFGELVLVSFNGLMPLKRQKNLSLPELSLMDINQLKYARLSNRPTNIGGTVVEAVHLAKRTKSIQSAFLVQNLGEIAVKTLDDHNQWNRQKLLKHLTESVVAEIFAKISLYKEFKEQVNQADMRYWSLLPERIHLVRLFLPASQDGDAYRVNVYYHSDGGEVIGKRSFKKVEIKAGEKIFLQTRFFRKPQI